MSLGKSEERRHVRSRRTSIGLMVEPLEGRTMLSGASPSNIGPPSPHVDVLSGQRPTVTTLQATTKTTPAGQQVILIASVNAYPHGRIVNSGRVRFSIVSPTEELLGFAHPNQRGAATLISRRLASSETYEILAQYIPSERIVGPSSATITVTTAEATATKFRITAPQFFGAPGTPVTFSVTALDRAGQVVTDYSGTIALESPTDHAAKLAAKKYTFTPADQGTHEFADGITFRKGGAEVLKVDQLNNTRIRGTATFGIE